MKYFPAIVAICAFLFVGGCSGSSGNNGNSDQNTNVETYQYRFSDNGCDTGPRFAVSRDQLCRNLQLDSSNNGCALDARKQYFQDHCPTVTWDPDGTHKALKAAHGASTNCFVSAGQPSLDDLADQKTYVNEQFTIDPLTVIPHDNFVAVITQSLKNGNFILHIKLMTSYPNGTVIAEGQKNWQDQNPDEYQLDGTSPPSRASCYPGIQ